MCSPSDFPPYADANYPGARDDIERRKANNVRQAVEYLALAGRRSSDRPVSPVISDRPAVATGRPRSVG